MTELALPQGISTIVAATSLSGTSVSITNIPNTYAYLVLVVAAASSGSTEQTQVQVDTDNGASFDTTAGNYIGVNRTGTTFALNTTASLTESTTHTSAQSDSFTLYLFGYQGGARPWSRARILQNSVEYVCEQSYIGSTSPINALKILGSAAGTFDAGTYVLYGVR